MWKMLGKAILHAAIGGAAVGAAAVAAGSSFKTIGMAALASAITSVLSLFSNKPSTMN